MKTRNSSESLHHATSNTATSEQRHALEFNALEAKIKLLEQKQQNTSNPELRIALMSLIIHLKESANKNKDTLVIEFGMFAEINEKITKKENPLFLSQLESIANETLLFLEGNKTLDQYQSYIAKLPGQVSDDLKNSANFLIALALLYIIALAVATTPAALAFCSIVALSSLLIGVTGHYLNQQSGFAHETALVAQTASM